MQLTQLMIGTPPLKELYFLFALSVLFFIMMPPQFNVEKMSIFHLLFFTCVCIVTCITSASDEEPKGIYILANGVYFVHKFSFFMTVCIAFLDGGQCPSVSATPIGQMGLEMG